jgi:hypothetical protein
MKNKEKEALTVECSSTQRWIDEQCCDEEKIYVDKDDKPSCCNNGTIYVGADYELYCCNGTVYNNDHNQSCSTGTVSYPKGRESGSCSS